MRRTLIAAGALSLAFLSPIAAAAAPPVNPDDINAQTVITPQNGDRSANCAVEWFTQAVVDHDLPNYSVNGWEIQVTGATGFFQMQHWSVPAGDEIYWRVPIGNVEPMNNVEVRFDFTAYENWVPDTTSFTRTSFADGTDPFTRFSGPAGFTPSVTDPTVVSFTEDELVVSLGDLPANTSMVIQFTTTALDPERVHGGETFRNAATLTADAPRGTTYCEWQTPPVPQDGNNSAQCVVDWYAESIIDLDLEHHATTGWNWQMIDNEWGYLQVHHWAATDKLFWRFPVATQYTIENAKLEVDLTDFERNWVADLTSFIQHGLVDGQDPFTRFAGPAIYTPLAEDWIATNGSVTFTEDSLVIDLGTLPAGSSLVSRISGVVNDMAALQGGETYTLGARLTGDYIPGEVPGCELPPPGPEPTTPEPTTPAPTTPAPTTPAPTTTPLAASPTKPLPPTGAEGTETLALAALGALATGVGLLGLRKRMA